MNKIIRESLSCITNIFIVKININKKLSTFRKHFEKKYDLTAR